MRRRYRAKLIILTHFKNLHVAAAFITVSAVFSSADFAAAQRAAENVVRAADDAFGAAVGDEEIGLYNSDSVRGFSPSNAGNIRVEGLSIDQQADFSARLVSGSTIRAGLAAQGYLLPAPTGIVDFSLRRVAADPVQSVIAARTNYGGYRISGDFQTRSSNGLIEAQGGAGYARAVASNGSVDKSFDVGGSIRFLPSRTFDATLFFDFGRRLQDQRWPFFFTAGNIEPPRFEDRTLFPGQPWIDLPATF